jgi:hypothetical protein
MTSLFLMIQVLWDILCQWVSSSDISKDRNAFMFFINSSAFHSYIHGLLHPVIEGKTTVRNPCKYRVITKSLRTWCLQYRKLQVMFKVSPASLQTFIDTPNSVLEDRVRYSTVHIPNIFYDGYLQLISCVWIVLYHNLQVHRDFLITLYLTIHCNILEDLNFLNYCFDYQNLMSLLL